MSIVKNPFYNKDFHPAQIHQDNVFSDIVGLGKDIIGAFKEKIDPAEQQRKAGVWNSMLKDFYNNKSMTGQQLANKYASAITKQFAQKKTAERFIKNNLVSQGREYIIDHLAQKVVDEINKGGEYFITKTDVLSNVSLTKDISPIAPTSTIGRPSLGSIIGTSTKTAAGQNPAFDVVKPLRPTMEKALNLKGITPSENIEVLTNQFYNEIVRKDQPNNFMGNNPMNEICSFDFSIDRADEATDAIITAVVTYIRGLKDKSESGQPLSRIQEVIVQGTTKAETIIKEKAKEEAAQKVGSDILFGGKWIYIIGGVLVAIVLIVLAVRK